MSDVYTIQPWPDLNTVSFRDSGKVFLTIKPDGSVVIPDGVTIDEAARTFWQVMEGYGPKKEIEQLKAVRDHLVIEQRELCDRVTELTAELAANGKTIRALGLMVENERNRANRLHAELAAATKDAASWKATAGQEREWAAEARAELAAAQRQARSEEVDKLAINAELCKWQAEAARLTAELAAERERREEHKRHLSNLEAVCNALTLDRTKLREALEPFVKWPDNKSSGDYNAAFRIAFADFEITYGDLRRANAALRETKGGGDE